PFPKVERVGEHVGLAAKREFFFLVPFAREFEGEPQTALDAATGVDAFLHRDLVRRALEHETARSGVKALVIFAHHDEVYVRRSFVLQRTEPVVVKFHRPKIDILLEFETESQEYPLLENARFHVRMTDGAEEDRRELSQFLDDTVRQGFLRAEIT